MQKDRTIAGKQIRVAVAGQGPPILFLHGYSGWEPQSEFLDLMAQRFTVVAPEIPGFGESERPEWLKELEDFAFFLRDFIREGEFSSAPCLVGHSFGGWIAAETAIRFGSQLAGLALISSMGLRDNDRPMADIFALPPDRLAVLEYLDGTAKLPDEEDLNHIRNRTNVARVAWHPRLFNPRLKERLQFIDVPTLVLWGVQDKVIPLSYAQMFAQGISDVRVEEIDGASHYPHVEQPEAVAKELSQFLDGLVGSH